MSDLMISENNRLVRQDIINQKSGYEVSDRYIPISTKEVIDEIKQYTGTEPRITGFNNANVRKIEKDGYQKHALIMQMPDAEMLDGTSINMVLFNSNDRSSALRIMIGSIRMACSNQLVWGSELTEPLSIRHTKQNWKYSIHGLMDEYQKVQQETHQTIQNMLNRYTSYGDIGRFTERVTEEIINPMITGSILDPIQLDVAHRKADVGKDLWHTFNRMQYNLINGGIDRIIQKEDDDGHLFDSISNTHKITDVKKSIEINRQLSDMAIELL